MPAQLTSPYNRPHVTFGSFGNHADGDFVTDIHRTGYAAYLTGNNFAPSASMSSTTTFQPFFASTWQHARPMPLAPPVTTTIRWEPDAFTTILPLR